MGKPLRALMVEDSEDDVLLTIRALKKDGYDPVYERVEDAVAMRKALREKSWDVILCDYQMPQFNGLAAIALLKETHIDIPLIIVSGAIGEEMAAECMRSGAHDYVMKGNLSRLAPAIERELKEAESRVKTKQMEEALRESEELFRSYLEYAPDGVYMSDLEGNFLYGNRKCEEIIGYRKEELIGKNFLELNILPENSLNKADQLLQANLEGKSTGPDEIDLVSKEGRIIPIEINTNVVQRMGQRIILAFVRDITERKRAEEALRESEALFHSLIDYMHDAMIILNWDGSILFANRAAARIIEFERPEEFVGHNMIEYLHPDSFQKAAEDLEAVKADKIGFLSEYQLCSVTGRRLWVESIGGKIIFRNASANLVCIRDITERKLAEEEREKMLLWQQGVNLLQQSLLTPATLEEKLRAITDSIVSLFDADFSRIWLIQPGDLCEQGCIHADVDEEPHICRYRDRCLHLLASSGRYTHTDGKIHRRVPFGCYKIGRVASDDDHKFLTNDVQNDPRIHDREWARELGLVSFVGYQLRAPGGKTLGVLALFAKRPITSPEDSILDGLSSAVALVIQRDVAEKSLRQTLESLRKAIGTTIQVMVSAIEVRDPYTAGHQIRSTDLARTIATEMGLPQNRIDGIRMAGSIHDIGKLSIPAEILSKPTKLMEIEFSLIKEHSRNGYEMLKDVESPWPLAEIIYQHHERMNGSGYPRNLKGDDILMEARILAVSDVVESMASHRPYRPALGIEAALDEIEKNKGTLYDNTVVDTCLRLFREKGFQLEGT